MITGENFKQNLQCFREFWPKDHTKQPKMTVSTGTKIVENLKLKNFGSDIAKTYSFNKN